MTNIEDAASAVDQLTEKLAKMDKKWLARQMSILFVAGHRVCGHKCMCEKCAEGLAEVLDLIARIRFVTPDEKVQ